MTTFTLQRPPDDAPLSPEGVVASALYRGPHGPGFSGYADHRLSTSAWGPHLPDARLEFGPHGRLDGERHKLTAPVALRIGDVTGQAVQPEWSLLSRRRRAVRASVGPRLYRYRVAGLTRSLLEWEDGTPVASLRGVFGANRIAEAADPTDVAVALVLIYGVSISDLTLQA